MKYKFAHFPRIGIIGGGQLAKMTALAAMKYGCSIVVLEKVKKSPSENLAIETLYGDWDDPKNLLDLAKKVDVVTLENEFVDAKSLRVIEENGIKIVAGERIYTDYVHDSIIELIFCEAKLDTNKIRD